MSSRCWSVGQLVTLIAAMLWCGTSLAEAQPSKPTMFTLDVSPKVGVVGDEFVVTVTVETKGVAGPDQYRAPDFASFKLTDSQVRSATSIVTKAGQRQISTTETRTYTLSAERAGTWFIGPARVRSAGANFETDRVKVAVGDRPLPVVTPDPDPTASGGVGAPGFRRPRVKGTPEVFLHVVVDEESPFVGQQTTVTWMLYSKEDLLSFEPTPPSLDGFWSEVVYEPNQHFPHQIDSVNGTRYRVAIVSKRALFPTRAGELRIDPFRANVQTLYSSLGVSQAVASKTIALRVLALPPGAPPGFDSSYVGEFQVASSVDRHQLGADESLTFTLEIGGVGAIRRTAPPKIVSNAFEFRAPRDFDENVDTSSRLLRGTRVYRYWTTPTKGGSQSIPAIQIDYFDPRTASYRVARSEAIAVTVSGTPNQGLASSAASAGASMGKEVNVIAPDIRLIRQGESISSVTMARAYRSVWYWALVASPALIFCGVIVVGRIRRRGPARATRNHRALFKVAEIHVRGGRARDLYGELAKVLEAAAEERAGVPVGSFTRAELLAVLEDNEVDEGLVERIGTELRAYDFARFAPGESDEGDLKNALDRSRQLVAELARSADRTANS